MKQRNRDYMAPWRQEHISQDFLADLMTQVDVELSGTSVALGKLATRAPLVARAARAMEKGGGPRGEGLVDLRQSKDEKELAQNRLLFQFRSSLAAKFGSLKQAFQALDLNKDGNLTYGELSQLLKEHGYSEDSAKERDIRVAFNLLDRRGVGHISLRDWLRGSDEDEDAGTAVEQLQTVKVGEVRKAIPLDQRPAWSRKKVATTPLGHLLLEVHREEDSLPPNPQKAKQQAAKTSKQATQQLWKRTEELLERKQKKVQAHIEHDEHQHSKEMTCKPKLAPGTRKLMEGGRHVKPWEGKTQDHERIFERKLREDLEMKEQEQVQHHTFQPQVAHRSQDLFYKLANDGEEWHHRMHNRSKEIKGDRLNLSIKKMTPDFEETWLRERTPQITKLASQRARSVDTTKDVYGRLHTNFGVYKPEPEDDSLTARYTRSVSFCAQPNASALPAAALRAASAQPRLGGGGNLHGSAGSQGNLESDDVSPARTVRTQSPSASPVKGGAPSMASTTASLGGASEWPPSASPTKHRVIATPHLVELLESCGSHARQLDMDAAADEMMMYGTFRSRQ